MTSETAKAIKKNTTLPTDPAPQKLWTRQFIVGTLLNFVIALNYFMFMVIMTAYALEKYDAPAAAAAFCASIFIVGTLFARFLSAPLMEKLGKHKLLCIFGVCVVIFTGLYSLSMPFILLFALRFIHGLSYGICSTTIATIVTGIVPKARKGEGIGYFMLSIPLGSALGPFIGVFISRNVSYEAAFLVAFIFSLLMIPCLIGLGKEKKPDNQNALEEEIQALDYVAAAESDAPIEEAKEAKAAESAFSVKKMLQPFVEYSVIPISFVCGLVFFGYSSLLTFLTPYSVEIGLSKAASVFFIVYACAMFLTRPFTGKAFDRYGSKPVMIPSFVSFCIGMVILALASNDWMILISGAFLGFAVGTIQSSGLSIAVNVAPDSRLSVANATFYMLLDIGVGIGPILLGIIVPIIGYSNLYFAMACIGIFAMIVFLVISRGKKA